jgi:hypothetical protein
MRQRSDLYSIALARKHDPTKSNAADDTQETTCKAALETVQQTPLHMQRATGKLQRTTRAARSVQQKTAGNMRHAVDDMQHVTNSVQRATGNMRRTSCHMQRATTSCNATDNMHLETGSVRHATENPVLCRQRGNDNRLRAPATNMQQGKRQQGNMRACSRQRATGSIQHATDIRPQTACKRMRAHASCNMKHTAPPHFVCGEQRAAGSGQPAVCAKHCPRHPVRNTAQTPHTRCNTRPYHPCRSMHQPVCRSMQAMQRTG